MDTFLTSIDSSPRGSPYRKEDHVMIGRPASDEFAPYASGYVSSVQDGDVLEMLAKQIEEVSRLLGGIGDEKASFRYAEGKWNIKEIIGHLCDTERVFAYRALRFARNDKAPLPGFEQDDYVENGGFDRRTIDDLLAEFRAVRSASIALFESFDDSALARRGTASGFGFTVRSVPFIVAGHVHHHFQAIRDRYV
jgi:hypothetical protein